jgi:hypothetical protein
MCNLHGEKRWQTNRATDWSFSELSSEQLRKALLYPPVAEDDLRDAMFRDYSCVLLEDCMGEPIGSGLPRSSHEASLLHGARICVNVCLS